MRENPFVVAFVTSPRWQIIRSLSIVVDEARVLGAMGSLRLPIDRVGPLFIVFLHHGRVVGLHSRSTRGSLGSMFAIDIPSSTGA